MPIETPTVHPIGLPPSTQQGEAHKMWFCWANTAYNQLFGSKFLSLGTCNPRIPILYELTPTVKDNSDISNKIVLQWRKKLSG